METENNAAVLDDPRAGLMQGIQELSSFNEFKRGIEDLADDPDSKTASKQTEEDRGTSSEDQTKTGPKAEKSEAEKSAASDLSDKTKEKETKEEVTDKSKEEVKQTVPRSQQRIREQAAEIARLKQELASKPEKKEEAVKQEVPQLIAPPQKPQYTREQLKTVLAQYREAGNDGMVNIIQDEIEKVRDYEIAMASWESKNARAWEQHQGHRAWYRQEANKKYPDIGRADSELASVHRDMTNYIKQNFPEVLNKPLIEYFLPVVADWSLRSHKAAAVEAKLKQVEKELADLKKGIQPHDQKSSVSKGTEKSSEIGETRNAIQEQLKSLNR